MLTFEPITPQSAPRMRPYYADCSYHLCEYSVGVKLNASVSRVDDETVIRMVGHGLGVTMMTEQYPNRMDSTMARFSQG